VCVFDVIDVIILVMGFNDLSTARAVLYIFFASTEPAPYHI